MNKLLLTLIFCCSFELISFAQIDIFKAIKKGSEIIEQHKKNAKQKPTISKKQSKDSNISTSITHEIQWIGSAHEYSELMDSFFEGRNYRVISESRFTGKAGVVDRSGEIVIPCKYHSIRILENGFIKVFKDNTTMGLYNTEIQQILPTTYKSISVYKIGNKSHFLVTTANDEHGIIDEKGNHIITPSIKNSINEPHWFYTWDENGKKKLKQSRYGILSVKGESIAKNIVFDENGKTIIPLKYDYITEIAEGIFQVGIAHGKFTQFGVINAEGKTIVPITYFAGKSGFADVSRFFGATAYPEVKRIHVFAMPNIEATHALGFISIDQTPTVRLFYDFDGNIVIPENKCQGMGVEYHPIEKAFATSIKRYGDSDVIIDPNGNIKSTKSIKELIGGARVSLLEYTKDGIFIQKKSSAVYDANNKLLIPESAGLVVSNFMQNGFAVAKNIKNNKMGLIDKYGKAKIPFLYNELKVIQASEFQKMETGYSDSYGFDKYFKLEDYPHTSKFVNRRTAPIDLIYAFKDGGVDIYNLDGTLRFKTTYNNIFDFDNKIATVERDGKFGLIDSSGKEIVSPQFTKIGSYDYMTGKTDYFNSRGILEVTTSDGSKKFITDEGVFVKNMGLEQEEIGNKIRYTDHLGRMIFEFDKKKFNDQQLYYNGRFSLVVKDDKFGYRIFGGTE